MNRTRLAGRAPRRVFFFLRVCVTGVAGLLAFWLACWTLVAGCLWWMALATLVHRLTARRALLLTATGVLLVPWCVVRYDQRANTLHDRVQTDGPTALRTHDRIAVWGLNLVMAGTGLALGFPEVALETASLAVPNGDLTVSNDTFPWCAPKVAAVLREPAPRDQRVAWTYHRPGESFRAALAMNPTRVRTRIVDGALHATASVPVNYPERSTLTFASLGPFRIQVHEGLFHALEESGWLFPYELTFETTRDVDAPMPPTCEAWSVRLGTWLTEE